MNKIDLNVKNFLEEKYLISTGSRRWWDIKTDFEIIGEEIMGILACKDYNESIDIAKYNDLKKNLEEFKVRVDTYKAQDDIEAKEKEILEKKIKIAIEIHAALINI